MPVVSSKKIAQRWSQASIRHLKVRILPPQPGSRTTGDCFILNRINARQWRIFLNWCFVSRLPIWTTTERNRRESPADIWNTPVFWRRPPETGFELHCGAGTQSRSTFSKEMKPRSLTSSAVDGRRPFVPFSLRRFGP